MARDEIWGRLSTAAPSETDIAWAAGLWAGEGSAGAFRVGHGRFQPQARLVMNDEWEVREFHRIAGFGRVAIYNPPGRQLSGHAPGWSWRVGALPDVTRLYALIGPYLSDRRCLQFEHAIALAGAAA